MAVVKKIIVVWDVMPYTACRGGTRHLPSRWIKKMFKKKVKYTK
jgi:hypothetical protein